MSRTNILSLVAGTVFGLFLAYLLINENEKDNLTKCDELLRGMNNSNQIILISDINNMLSQITYIENEDKNKLLNNICLVLKIKVESVLRNDNEHKFIKNDVIQKANRIIEEYRKKGLCSVDYENK